MMFNLNESIRNSSGPQRALNMLEAEAIESLRDKWLDEAAAAAVAGNPVRAQYINQLAGA